MQSSSKKTEILDFAQDLLQRKGYNGFSYADISEMVGIRKASIHHHFQSKEILAVAVIRRYKEIFFNHLSQIARENCNWIDKIRQYSKLYEEVLCEDKLCLCGMLATDLETLPKTLKKEIQAFFTDNVTWLIQILSSQHKTLTKKRMEDIAWQIISSLQGAVIIARTLDNTKLFTSASNQLFTQLENLK